LFDQAPLGAHSTLAGSVEISAKQTSTGAAHGSAYYYRPSDIRVAMAMALFLRNENVFHGYLF
jgi:hypothetical protein